MVQVLHTAVGDMPDESYAILMLEDVVPRFLNILKLAPLEKLCSSDNFLNTILKFFLRISKFACVASYINQTGSRQIFEEISSSSDAFKCFISELVLVNLCGKEEHVKGGEGLLESKPDILLNVVRILKFTVDEIGGDHPTLGSTFGTYGTFSLRSLVYSLYLLSVSDANKQRLVNEPELIYCIIKVLDRYRINGEQFCARGNSVLQFCGGGGQDAETASISISFLVQLSFYFQTNDELQTYFGSSDPEVNISEMFVDLQKPRVGCVKLEKEPIGFCRHLHSRLVSSDKSTTINTVLVANSDGGVIDSTALHDAIPTISSCPVLENIDQDKHVMISYNHECKSEDVRKFASLLRSRFNIDIWIDYEGSTLQAPMSNDIYCAMSEALEKSIAVIICVSKEVCKFILLVKLVSIYNVIYATL
jgi:hypothetical protein